MSTTSLEMFDQFGVDDIDDFSMVTIGKQGVGKTTLIKLLTFRSEVETSTSLNAGTKNFTNEKKTIKTEDGKTIRISIMDTIGFDGSEDDGRLMGKLVQHMQSTYKEIHLFVLVFAQHRFDSTDAVILDLIHSELYSKIKDHLIVIVTHCPAKKTEAIKQEIVSKHVIFEKCVEMEAIMFVDTPDPEVVDDEIKEFYIKKWQQYRKDLLTLTFRFNSNPLSVYDLFTKEKLEKMEKRIRLLETKHKKICPIQ